MVQETLITKKKRGPAPTGVGTFIGVRLQPADLAALDQHIAQQPEPKPSRPEAIRRVLSKALGDEPSAATTAPCPERATRARKPATGARAARDTNAREHAEGVADGEMEGMDATAAVKRQRRDALTERPAMVAKARGKRSR